MLEEYTHQINYWIYCLILYFLEIKEYFSLCQCNHILDAKNA